MADEIRTRTPTPPDRSVPMKCVRVTPKPYCELCNGRGIQGRDLTTGEPVRCKCLTYFWVREDAEGKVIT